ncbi:MAG TPA: hypothetical protein VNU66_13205 [Mycobacteriales bacterium]|nr:hypothetical protein [Mycobacteriales bacterium]
MLLPGALLVAVLATGVGATSSSTTADAGPSQAPVTELHVVDASR